MTTNAAVMSSDLSPDSTTCATSIGTTRRVSFSPGDANDKVTSTTSNTNTHKCTICPQQFDNLKDCLKHELLDHSLQKANPQHKALRSKLHSILKSFNEDDNQTMRTQLSQALGKCVSGEELATIFQFHRMNAENLELVYARIYNCLEKELQSIKSLKIVPFGSIASGLALRGSDIDIYIEHTSERGSPYTLTFNRINRLLHRSKCFEEVFALRKTRVPIIKCKHAPTGFSLDINMSCPSSVHNTNFLRDVILYDKRLHEFLLFLKIWAKQLRLVGCGNMTSYCLIMLALFYLQQQPSSKQQTKASSPVLPSVQQLQAGTQPDMVLGVNYAYNINANMQPLPETFSVMTLLNGFFEFYSQFDFEHLIVTPFLGVAVSVEQFQLGEFKYDAYVNQLRALSILNGAPAEPLLLGRSMCVQDPFCLNLNVAKSISPPNLEYFRRCVQYAQRICVEADGASSDASLYEALLCGIVEQFARSAELENANATTNQPSVLSYRFTPCRAEMRVLAGKANSLTADNASLYRLWIRHYIEAISEIITEVYRLDMQLASPTHNDKHQRLEHADRQRIWLLSGSVDMWTGRLHQRANNQTFMECQLAQTKAFQSERRQNAAYAVQLNGLLTLNIICDSTAIELSVSQRDKSGATGSGLGKKDPLRKFFTMFKCSMQNFNLKEKLQTEPSSDAVRLQAGLLKF